MGGTILKIAKKIYTEAAASGIDYFSSKDITTAASGQIHEKAADGIVFGKADESPLLKMAIVKNAYFAVKKYENFYSKSTITHIVHKTSKSSSLSAIAKEYKEVSVSDIKKDNNLTSNTIHPKQKLKITTRVLKGQKVVFEKKDSGAIGEDLYVIVQTSGLQGSTIMSYVMQGKEKGIVEKGNAITIMQGEKEVADIQAKVGAYKDEKEIINKNDFKDWAITKVKLQPKGEAKIKSWRKILKDLSEKKTYFYLLVDAQADKEDFDIEYYGFKEEGKEQDQGGFNNCWLDRKNSWFVLEGRKMCPIDPKYRSHFVIHCTAGKMTEKSIKKKTKFDTPKKKRRSAAHIYVNDDGSKLEIWPFTEKNVWATKIESRKGLKGQMFHVELNYGAPSVPSEAMYKTLADLYIEASDIEECWPVIVPHIEVDRGIADGHQDPTDFDYNHFYSILKSKGIPIDDIKKFDHNRYWGKSSYKIPWGSDKTTWPPILKGNPHK